MDAHVPHMKKRKRGQLQRQQCIEQEMTHESALYGLLMLWFAQGVLSGAKVHSLALAAQIDIDKAADGYQVTKIREVSKLKYARNLDRSIAALMAKEADLPSPFEVSIPMKGQVDQVPSAAILLPHEMFAAFYEKTTSWTSSVLPDSSSIQKFWQAFQHHPMMAGHPIKEKPDWHATTVPIGIHGDEVPVMGVGKIWCRSVLAFSWFSLLASAAGQGFERTNILIWGVFEKFRLPDGHDGDNSLGTMQFFWKIMQWSFDNMMNGKWPHRDWRGVPYSRQSPEGRRAGSWLAGGYRGALVQVAGDCDFFTKWLQTPQVTNHQKPCVLCTCSYRGPCSEGLRGDALLIARDLGLDTLTQEGGLEHLVERIKSHVFPRA